MSTPGETGIPPVPPGDTINQIFKIILIWESNAG